KTINTTLDQPRIKQVRFKQAERKQPKKEIVRQFYVPKQVILSQQEEHALDLVDDPSLRNALKTFLIRCYQENTSHEKSNNSLSLPAPSRTQLPHRSKSRLS